MARWLPALATILCLTTTAFAEVNGFAEPEEASLTLVKPRPRGLERLAGLWGRRRGALERGDGEAVARITEEAAVLRRELGVQRLDAIGYALVREAQGAIAEGKVALASARLDAADGMAPGLPEIAETRAALASAESAFALHRVALFKVDGMRRQLGDFERRMLIYSDGILTALILGAVLGLLFLLAQLARYGLNLYQDLGQTFPSVMRVLLLAALGIAALLPIFYGFGPFLLVAPVLVALWSYQNLSERLVSVAVTLALGVLPWMLRAGDRLSDAGTGLEQAIHSLSINPYDARAEAKVEAAAAADEGDWYARAVLGLALKRQGRLREAAQLLTDAARTADDDRAAAAIWTNLGNTWFGLGRPQAAQEALEQATRLDRRSAIAWFNLHRLHLRRRQKPEAEAALGKATALDTTRVSEWAADDDAGLNRYVVDAPLPDRFLVGRAFDRLLEPSSFAHRVWRDLAGPLPELAAPAAGGAALLAFAFLFGIRRRMRLSWPCTRCGQRADVPLAQGHPEQPVCTQCDAIFVRNVPTDRRSRFEKESQVERFQGLVRWGRRLSAVALPGLGDLVRGRAARGLLLAGFAGWLGLRVLIPRGVLMTPYAPPAEP
ncbi:MAG: hypothetical protein KC613_01165, partial [Myxococcales bacterium]|nr:hypothetical protein [Myxococcales bacterium]